jgi:prevent-host-death family protein
MGKLPDIVPVSDLRQDAAKVLQRVHKSKEPMIITQRGRAVAVLLSVELYERFEREKEILYLLAQGEREIAAGEGFGLEEVLARADALLAADSK